MKRRVMAFIAALLFICCTLCGGAVYAQNHAETAAAAEDSVNYSDAGIPYGFVCEENETGLTIVAYNDELTKVVIPSDIGGTAVTAIGREAFAQNRSIKSVVIPDSVTSIGEGAFHGCESLSDVTMSASVTEFPNDLFKNCTMLDTFKLPESLTKICDGAFYGCLLLPSLRIPASVTFIGDDAFLGCESIVLDCSDNDYAYDFAQSHLVSTEEGMLFPVLAVVTVIIIAVFVYIYRNPGVVRRFCTAFGIGGKKKK